MFKLPAFVAKSFKKPQGITGIITGWIMKKYNFFVYPVIDKYSDIKDGMKILEIGYGPGEGLKYFSEKYNVRIDGVDFSEQMYEKAKRRNYKFVKNGALNICCDDFLSMDLKEQTYDRIIFANVIYFWSDINAAFTKIKSLLRDEGKLVFFMTGPDYLKKSKLTDNEHFEHYDMETVLNVLRECGFSSPEQIKLKDNSGNYNIIKANI